MDKSAEPKSLKEILKRSFKNFGEKVFFNAERLAFIVGDYPKSESDALCALRELYMRNYKDKDKKFSLMDIDDKRKPLAAEHMINTRFIFDRNADGFLRPYMSMFFNEVFNCRNSRGKQVNSAAGIFLAEMAEWASDMAKHGASEELIAELKTRVDIILDIESYVVFRHETDYSDSMYMLLFNLRVLLEEDIIPITRARLSQFTSRECFDSLYLNSIQVIEAMSQLLFYFFTEQSQVPLKFSVVTQSTLADKHFKRAISSPLGKQFAQLRINYQTISKLDRLDEQLLIEDDQREIISSCFDEKFDETKIRDSALTASEVTGIHPVFIEYQYISHEKLDLLLSEALSLFNDFCYVINAIKKAYALAGAGGDILLYMALVKETRQVLANFEFLASRIQSVTHQLNTSCNKIIRYIFETKLLHQDEHYKNWKEFNEVRFRKFSSEAQLALEKCNSSIIKIQQAMEKVQSREYADEIEREVKNYQGMVRFLTRKLQGDPTIGTSLPLLEHKEAEEKETASPRSQTSEALQSSSSSLAEQLGTGGLFGSPSAGTLTSPDLNPSTKGSKKSLPVPIPRAAVSEETRSVVSTSPASSVSQTTSSSAPTKSLLKRRDSESELTKEKQSGLQKFLGKVAGEKKDKVRKRSNSASEYEKFAIETKDLLERTRATQEEVKAQVSSISHQ